MQPSPILLGLFLALCSRLSAATPGQSHLYQDSQTTRKVRVYIPGNLSVVRGILFIGNGAGGDASFDADKAHFQSWADKHGFAIAATGFFSYFQEGVGGHDWRVLWEGLHSAATASGHPELLHAPFVNWGFSNGGQMAYGLARLQPEKTIAFIVNKGGFYQTTHGTEPLGVPALFIAGEIDNTNNRRATIETLYKNGRALSAPWAWLEERRAGHVLGNSEPLAFGFFEEVLALRYPDDPANVPSADAPPALAPVTLTDGWLVDQEHAAWSTGFLGIRPAQGYADDPLQKGWVPSESAARLYRASASYDPIVSIFFAGGYQKSAEVTLPYPAVDGGTLLPARAVYHPGQPVAFELNFPDTHTNWSALRFYDGATLLATHSNPGASATLSVDITPLPGLRLNAIHAEIDFPGGLTRSTHPVWLTPDAVRAPLPPEVLTPPTELTGTVLSASGADLTWTRTSLQESGFEIQRRIAPSGSAAVLNPPSPVNGIWTWTPGLEGRFEIAARSTRTPNGETRAPYSLPDASTVAVNQSNHGPADLEWEFQDATEGATLNQVSQTGTRSIGNWTAGISGSGVSNQTFRIRSATTAESFAGGTSLAYNSGIVVLEADFDGWNVTGGSTGQWFQLSLNTGVNAEITAGITLEQNASGLLFYGRALGTNTSNTPAQQFPNTQSGPVTLRLQIDFDSDTLTASYRSPESNGAFVQVGTGTLDSARSGASLRLRMSGDWSGSGEFIDLSRIRILPAPPAEADPAEWVVLGTQDLITASTIQLGTQGTRAPVVADALQFTPVTLWETVATLPAQSTGWSDSTLSPGTAYEYRIRALGAESVGDWSDILGVQVPHALPRAVLQNTADGLRIHFDRASAELDYIIESTSDLTANDWSEITRNPGTVGESVTVPIPTGTHTHLFLRVRVE
jgi:hypothetical protein